MNKALIINAHQPYERSKGGLNAELVKRIDALLQNKGYDTKLSAVAQDYDTNEEVEKHVWADVVIIQAPVNWMGMPWSMKKYMDDVYTMGMDGRLCTSDGRSMDNPDINYGTGGTCQEKKYMLSVTFNAPKNAFNNADEYLFQGRGVDDLFLPSHANFRFFGMTGIDSFVCYDVMKNPSIENDFKRLEEHIDTHF